MREVSPRMRISTCVSREHLPFANPGNATVSGDNRRQSLYVRALRALHGYIFCS